MGLDGFFIFSSVTDITFPGEFANRQMQAVNKRNKQQRFISVSVSRRKGRFETSVDIVDHMAIVIRLQGYKIN